MKITKDILISHLIRMDQEIEYILNEKGMHCSGCAASRNETLEQACAVHGLNCEEVVEDINEYLDWTSL